MSNNLSVFGAILLLLASCSGYKELPVEYDYSYKGQFRRYRSFDMQAAQLNDSTQSNEIIEKSIVSRMKFLGYTRSERRPQLLVSYKIYTDSLRLKAFKQPDMGDFLRVQYKESQKELGYEPIRLGLNTGTLMIQFYDVKQRRNVWHGYAVGLSRTMDYGSTRQLRNAVISILDQYKVWAEGFLGSPEIKDQWDN